MAHLYKQSDLIQCNTMTCRQRTRMHGIMCEQRVIWQNERMKQGMTQRMSKSCGPHIKLTKKRQRWQWDYAKVSLTYIHT